MRPFYSAAVFLLALSLSIQHIAAQAWLPSGMSDQNQPSYYTGRESAIAVAPDGTLYVAYKDSVQAGKVTVKKNIGGAWSLVGTAGFSPAAITSIKIKVDAANVPYVLFQEVSSTANGVDATVMRYNGAAWVNVGAPAFATQFEKLYQATDVANQTADLAFNATNTPYVVYQNFDGGVLSLVPTVKQFDGTSWVAVGATDITGSAFGAYSVSIAINDATGVPYVAVHDFNDEVRVYRFQSGSWSALGGAVSTGFVIRGLDLELAGTTQVPTVAFLNFTYSETIFVSQYVGSAWTAVGGSVTATPAQYPDLSANSSGDLYVTYRTNLNGIPHASLFSGGAWADIGANISGGASEFLASTVDNSDNLVAVYQDKLNNNKISVKSFIAGAWSFYGTEAASPGLARFPTVQYNGAGAAYIAYQDVQNGFKASVRKYNTGAWEPAGLEGFSQGIANYVSMTMQYSTNTPFVAYQDVSASNKLSVQYLATDGWTYVVSQGVSTGAASLIKTASDGINIYVAFADGSQSNKLTVMMYDGLVWSTVGTAGFSAGAVTDLDIKVAGTSVTVAYADASLSNKLVVRQFNGASWLSVGAASGISTNAAHSISLGSKNSINLDVAFQDGTGNGVRVIEFNGTAWANLGSTPIATTATDVIVMAVVGNTVYVAYQDNANGGKATVLQQDGGATPWTLVDHAAISSGKVTAVSLSESSTGYLSLAYLDNLLWVQTYETGTLPVKLSQYEVEKVNNTAEVTWTTAQEQNSAYFVIERSSDGTSFSAIGTVNAAGNSSSSLSYNFSDKQPQAGYNYYRLVEVDADGQQTYFAVKRLYFGNTATALQLYPNPAVSTVTLRGEFSTADQIQVLDLTGHILIRQRGQDSNQITINVSNLPSGMYFVRITGINRQETLKLQKQ